jgi:magnesium transporter
MAADLRGPTSERVTVWTIETGEIAARSDRLDREGLRAVAASALTWIDLIDPSPATLRSLEGMCGLHPRIVDKTLKPHRTPAVTVLDDTTHIVLHVPLLREDAHLITREVQMILRERLLVTVHEPDAIEVAGLLDHWRGAPEARRSTAGSLLYATLRMIIAAFVAAADSLDVSLKRLHDEVITEEQVTMPERRLLFALFDVTEQIADLHHMAEPAVSIMQRLERNHEWFADDEGTDHSQDLVDEASLLASRLRLMGDTAGRLLDSCYALITLRSTDMSNRLTIVATIFLLLSFLSSYFGQNFQYLIDGIGSCGQFVVWGAAVPLLSLSVILVLLHRFGAFD